MLLAIEQGNTNTLFAVHDGTTWIAQWRAATEATRTADEYAVWVSQFLQMQGLALDVDSTTFFLGRETLVPGEHPSLPRWRVALYMWLASNALTPARFYHLPPGRVVELGTQVTI